MEALVNGTAADTTAARTAGPATPANDGNFQKQPENGELQKQFTQTSGINTAHTTLVEVTPDEGVDSRGWLTELRGELSEAGQYLAYRAPEGGVKCFQLQREWTRIGRSLAADIRFDDPTVSRRHALIVRQADGLRVLDDRSLNGVFVNGERVEWSTLADGDEVVIGRHHLHFLDVPVVSGMRPAAS